MTVEEIVTAATRRLDAELLDVAAVLGDPFDPELVAEILGVEVLDVLGGLGRAGQAGAVVERAPGRWSFAEPGDADGRRAGMPPERLAAWSAAAYSAAGTRVSAESRARSASAAVGLVPRATIVEALQEAAAEASGRSDHAAAAHWCHAALAVLPDDTSPSVRAALLVLLAEALRAAGDVGGAHDALGAAVRLAPEPAVLARAALAYVDPGTEMGLACAEFDPVATTMLEAALRGLGDAHGAVAALVRVRLASQLYFSAEPERAEPLADAALTAARAAGDDRVLFAALSTHHDGYVVGRCPPAEAAQGSAGLVALARRIGSAGELLAARRARVIDLLACGDLAGVDAEIAAFDRLAGDAGDAAVRWWPAMWRAMRFHLDGRIGDAEQAAAAAFELGAARFPTLAAANYGFLLFHCRWDQGRLQEVESAVRSFAREHASIPAIEPSLALVLAETGQVEEARDVLARVVTSERLYDRNWPSSWFHLSRAAFLVQDAAAAEHLLERGGHLSGQTVQVSLGTVCLGAADLAVAWLHHTAADHARADAAYGRAEATNRRLGARGALARTYADRAELWAGRDDDRCRELAAAALAIAEPLGLGAAATTARHASGASTTSAPSPPSGRARFRREGSVWVVEYGPTAVRLPHAKGLADLAVLLARPGQSVPSVELMARDGGLVSEGRGDPLLDEEARHELRRRIEAIDREIAEASEAGFTLRADRLRDERDELVRAAATALGLGGRSRRAPDSAERARKAVTARVRNAVDRIRSVHPPLAAHLDRSIDTGAWSAYRPEQPVDWDV